VIKIKGGPTTMTDQQWEEWFAGLFASINGDAGLLYVWPHVWMGLLACGIADDAMRYLRQSGNAAGRRIFAVCPQSSAQTSRCPGTKQGRCTCGGLPWGNLGQAFLCA
jgi:hypothetical protein